MWRKLTAEEMEAKRAEMLQNAQDRDTQRAENVKRYREDDEKERLRAEKSATATPAAGFVQWATHKLTYLILAPCSASKHFCQIWPSTTSMQFLVQFFSQLCCIEIAERTWRSICIASRWQCFDEEMLGLCVPTSYTGDLIQLVLVYHSLSDWQTDVLVDWINMAFYDYSVRRRQQRQQFN